MALVDAGRLALQTPDALFGLAVGVDEILLHDEAGLALAAPDDVDGELAPQVPEAILEYAPGPATPIEIGEEVEGRLAVCEILDAHLLTTGKGESGQRCSGHTIGSHGFCSSEAPRWITAASAA